MPSHVSHSLQPGQRNSPFNSHLASIHCWAFWLMLARGGDGGSTLHTWTMNVMHSISLAEWQPEKIDWKIQIEEAQSLIAAMQCHACRSRMKFKTNPHVLGGICTSLKRKIASMRTFCSPSPSTFLHSPRRMHTRAMKWRALFLFCSRNMRTRRGCKVNG